MIKTYVTLARTFQSLKKTNVGSHLRYLYDKYIHGIFLKNRKIFYMKIIRIYYIFSTISKSCVFEEVDYLKSVNCRCYANISSF